MVYAFSLLSKYVVFLAQGIVTLYLLSLTIFLIGLSGAHRWETRNPYLQTFIA
jgi:uncharacterized iron-regulated membrane protein